MGFLRVLFVIALADTRPTFPASSRNGPFIAIGSTAFGHRRGGTYPLRPCFANSRAIGGKSIVVRRCTSVLAARRVMDPALASSVQWRGDRRLPPVFPPPDRTLDVWHAAMAVPDAVARLRAIRGDARRSGTRRRLWSGAVQRQRSDAAPGGDAGTFGTSGTYAPGKPWRGPSHDDGSDGAGCSTGTAHRPSKRCNASWCAVCFQRGVSKCAACVLCRTPAGPLPAAGSALATDIGSGAALSPCQLPARSARPTWFCPIAVPALPPVFSCPIRACVAVRCIGARC